MKIVLITLDKYEQLKEKAECNEAKIEELVARRKEDVNKIRMEVLRLTIDKKKLGDQVRALNEHICDLHEQTKPVVSDILFKGVLWILAIIGVIYILLDLNGSLYHF